MLVKLKLMEEKMDGWMEVQVLRVLRPSVDPREAEGRANTIMMHPGFRMVVLANRPGFPFLGNDFFGALGTAKTPEAHPLTHTRVVLHHHLSKKRSKA